MHDEYVRKQLLALMQGRTSRAGQAQINLEHDTVSLIMKTFRVEKYLTVLRNAQQAKFDTRNLSIATFNDEASGFPYLLVCSTLGGIKLHDDKRSTLPKMFASLEATPLGEAFIAAQKIISKLHRGDTRPTCLIVKRLNVRGGLAMYPSGEQMEEEVPGLRLCYTPSEESRLPAMTIEPFVSLLARLKKVWTPQFVSRED